MDENFMVKLPDVQNIELTVNGMLIMTPPATHRIGIASFQQVRLVLHRFTRESKHPCLSSPIIKERAVDAKLAQHPPDAPRLLVAEGAK
jgi:hypothetical protein